MHQGMAKGAYLLHMCAERSSGKRMAFVFDMMPLVIRSHNLNPVIPNFMQGDMTLL